MLKGITLSGFLAFAALPAFAQAQTDSLVPTIPESQIQASKLSSTYEFLSAATSIDDFEVKSAALAAQNAESGDVKAFASEMATAHAATAKEAIAAGKTEKVEIATPSVDGEQQGLLTKLESLKGHDFDVSYLEAQLFAHQRAIAIYRGYAGENNSLGQFAAATLPKVVGHYNKLLELAKQFKLDAPSQPPAKKS